MSLQPTMYELSCGVPLLEAHDPNRHTAFILFMYGIGARHEEPKENGISHFLEHLAFKGTDVRTALDIKTQFAVIGAKYNAFTTHEGTAYFVDALGEDIPEALDILSDIALNISPPEHEIDTERGPIIQELKGNLDDSDRVMKETVRKLAFPNQGLGQTIIGPLENIKSGISREDLLLFRDENYTASNLQIAIAGNYDQDHVHQTLNKKLRNLKKGIKAEDNFTGYVGGDQRIQSSDEHVHFTLAFNAPAIGHPLSEATLLLSSALGGGMDSRLFQEIREKRGLVYSVGARHIPFSGTGIFIAGGAADSDNVAQANLILIEELKKAAEGITQTELDIAKRKNKVGTLRASESLENQAFALEYIMRNRGELVTPESDIKRYEAVTLEDIRKAANFVFSSTPTFVAVGPVEDSGLPSYDVICNKLTL